MRTRKIKIGDYVFVSDNSYSFTVGTTIKPCLAGYLNQDELPRKRVMVASKPYILKIWVSTSIGMVKRKMITVMCDGECHVVRNNLTRT